MIFCRGSSPLDERTDVFRQELDQFLAVNLRLLVSSEQASLEDGLGSRGGKGGVLLRLLGNLQIECQWSVAPPLLLLKRSGKECGVTYVLVELPPIVPRVKTDELRTAEESQTSFRRRSGQRRRPTLKREKRSSRALVTVTGQSRRGSACVAEGSRLGPPKPTRRSAVRRRKRVSLKRWTKTYST